MCWTYIPATSTKSLFSRVLLCGSRPSAWLLRMSAQGPIEIQLQSFNAFPSTKRVYSSNTAFYPLRRHSTRRPTLHPPVSCIPKRLDHLRPMSSALSALDPEVAEPLRAAIMPSLSLPINRPSFLLANWSPYLPAHSPRHAPPPRRAHPPNHRLYVSRNARTSPELTAPPQISNPASW